MVFTLPNAVRFKTLMEINLAGSVETAKMRKVHTFFFRKTKDKTFLGLIWYIALNGSGNKRIWWYGVVTVGLKLCCTDGTNQSLFCGNGNDVTLHVFRYFPI